MQSILVLYSALILVSVLLFITIGCLNIEEKFVLAIILLAIAYVVLVIKKLYKDRKENRNG